MPSRADKYRCNAASCTSVDYGSRASVRRFNAASDRMRKIVERAYADGPESVAELIPLLDESPSNQWLAFQLLEAGKPPDKVIKKCLKIIRGLIRTYTETGNSADAMGMSLWLKEWSASRSRKQRLPAREPRDDERGR